MALYVRLSMFYAAAVFVAVSADDLDLQKTRRRSLS